MRVKKVLSSLLIIIFSLGLIAGAVWALDFFAVISVRKIAGNIPVVNRYISPGKVKDKKNPLENNPLYKENELLKEKNKQLAAEKDRLNKEIGDLQKKIEVAGQEKQALLEARNNLQAALDSLQATEDEASAADLNYEKLANYYAEMKPADAVKIMANLTDEVNIGILQKLEDEQVAKILSAMDPVKAAEIVDKMNQ